MRALVLILALLTFSWAAAKGPANVARSFPLPAYSAMHGENKITNPRVDFDSEIKPIFQSNCMPCHFNGGKMYQSLPFDRPETIRKLGEKLFTRIKDEKHRQTIRGFLAQSAE